MVMIGHETWEYDEPYEFYIAWFDEEEQQKILNDWNTKYGYNYDDFEELSQKLIDTNEYEWYSQFEDLIELSEYMFTADTVHDTHNTWYRVHQLSTRQYDRIKEIVNNA